MDKVQALPQRLCLERNLNSKFLLYYVILLISATVLCEYGFALDIIVVTKKIGGSVVAYFEPDTRDIERPVEFKWLFGDGLESSEVVPAPHYYNAGGIYNVLIGVTNKAGKMYTASVTIDVASPIGGAPLCSMTQSTD